MLMGGGGGGEKHQRDLSGLKPVLMLVGRAESRGSETWAGISSARDEFSHHFLLQ